MADVRVFPCRRRNLPPMSDLSGDVSQALNVVLDELAAFVEQVQPARVVWDLTDNNLTFAHVCCTLQTDCRIRKRPIRLHALDLCFNRIHVPNWRAFLPLLKRLAGCVEYLEFGGYYLPAINETDAELGDPVFEKVNLAQPSVILTGNDWVDAWSKRAMTFKWQAYGVSTDG